MIDYIIRFIGCVNLLVFFATDFFFAYVLHQLKQEHPAIDDCAPGDDEVDTVAILAGLHRGDIGISDIGNAALGGNRKSTSVEDGDLRGGGSGSTTAVNAERQKIIHRLVIIASFSGPVFSILQIFAPDSMSWSLFSVPSWLGYLTAIPGLGIAMFYASRAVRVSNFVDVSKTQWLSMMWFRLDMMCVMATVMLLAWGDWLVALCIFTVALYLAHRLLVTEKKLASEVKATQLIREEINLQTINTSINGAVGGADSDRTGGYQSLRRN